MPSRPHRKRLRRFERRGHPHELTFSCYRRKPLLTNDRWRTNLSRELNIACQAEGVGLAAFVFMPEHVHLLVLPLTPDSKVSRLLALTNLAQVHVQLGELDRSYACCREALACDPDGAGAFSAIATHHTDRFTAADHGGARVCREIVFTRTKVPSPQQGQH